MAGITRVMARERGEQNIRVNAVKPRITEIKKENVRRARVPVAEYVRSDEAEQGSGPGETVGERGSRAPEGRQAAGRRPGARAKGPH